MIIIPARLESSRFPKKVLVPINGVPMFVATAKRVLELDDVVIATDSEEIRSVASEYSLKSVMTSKAHKSGTDRINEAAQILDLKSDELILNVQADEPFIEPEVIKQAINALSKIKRDFVMLSCYKKIAPPFASDPNHVKVVIDANGDAVYFSRSKIPYDRQEYHGYFGHLGIYGFNRRSLQEFCSFGVCELEDTEKLEQLRAIYWGKKIAMIEVRSESFGIDSLEDLDRAMNVFK